MFKNAEYVVFETMKLIEIKDRIVLDICECPNLGEIWGFESDFLRHLYLSKRRAKLARWFLFTHVQVLGMDYPKGFRVGESESGQS
jgi:hypothetical protein